MTKIVSIVPDIYVHIWAYESYRKQKWTEGTSRPTKIG